ncbi:DUF262 domain-containing protein [Fictibacillus enclensis]|uniref:GmrSD restriction endonuclease domain-containing protein n=1 Tax=Fictibacillus enclensis TaxID=1017270 RepID=UPI0025A19487|nr:DUF262 domain-containing protein [Fictibacillus enclensis]MDM5201095.1 DUF262 domain-containing protein [Fictibacillus enclensis]
MTSVTNFDSTKESLQDLLKSISSGKTQLPDFQRGWVWDDNHIKSLIASVSLSYPIGAVMMLQTGNSEVNFKPKPVEGVTLLQAQEPERLILDGQQRLTSLTQSLHLEKPVLTRDIRGKTIKRWYYIDIHKALDPFYDREESIIGLPEEKVIKNFRGQVINDYSTLERECEAGLFPFTRIFDTAKITEWQMKFLQMNPEKIQERLQTWNQFSDIIQRFQQYQIPLIILRKETPKEAVCQVFEKVNTGGVPLTAFELLTATFAADDFNLRKDWETRKTRLFQQKVLKSNQSTDFLQTISLLATYDRKRENADVPISCKRKDVLKLSLQEYQNWAEPATAGYETGAKFLFSQNIFSERDLPYRTQLVPLAAIYAILGDKVHNDSIRKKIAQWFWCGVLGELYGSTIETRFAKDVQEVLEWINGGNPPSTVQDANFSPTRLYTLRTRNSAAYKGISTLLLREGGQDFRSGETVTVQMYFDDQIDIHHIFPSAYCTTKSIERGRCDSIVNKTPLSAKTNRMIGGNAPGSYLERIQKNTGITKERMDEILHSHVIDPESLRLNDFDSFFEKREEKLLSIIENAMGKQIARPAVNHPIY